MFGSKNKDNPIKVTKLDSWIWEKAEFHGDIYFSGTLRIDGKVRGNVISRDGEPGVLVLTSKGMIEGQVKVYDAIVDGSIVGEVHISHFLELKANARVEGNISYEQLQMDRGAAVKGHLLALVGTPDAEKVVKLNQQGERNSA